MTFFFFFSVYNMVCLFTIYVSLALLDVPCFAHFLVVRSSGQTSLRYAGFSLWWLLLLGSTGSGCRGFSSCGDQGLSCSGACGIFPDRGFERTRVPCVGRQILILCATRKVRCVTFCLARIKRSDRSKDLIQGLYVCRYVVDILYI